MADVRTIQIQEKNFNKFISSSKIQKAVASIAKKINKDYKNETPVFIAVLNGSFMFSGDLLKKINIDCEISFIKIASYRGAKSTGKTKKLIGLNEKLKGRSVIVLEDIVDTGKTLQEVLYLLKKQSPASVKIATLFFKPSAYKKKIKMDYIGINIPDKFIVGYGLDYNGLGRNLNNIYSLKS